MLALRFSSERRSGAPHHVVKARNAYRHRAHCADLQVSTSALESTNNLSASKSCSREAILFARARVQCLPRLTCHVPRWVTKPKRAEIAAMPRLAAD